MIGILVEAMKVESRYEESFVSVKEVVKVEKQNKMIKTLFLVKSTHWHKEETNCKRNEVMKKTKMISQVKYDKSLNLTHVYSH